MTATSEPQQPPATSFNRSRPQIHTRVRQDPLWEDILDVVHFSPGWNITLVIHSAYRMILDRQRARGLTLTDPWSGVETWKAPDEAFPPAEGELPHGPVPGEGLEGATARISVRIDPALWEEWKGYVYWVPPHSQRVATEEALEAWLQDFNSRDQPYDRRRIPLPEGGSRRQRLPHQIKKAGESFPWRPDREAGDSD